MGLGLSAGERRRAPRLPLDLAAHCQIGGSYSRSSVVDVSRSGLSLRTVGKIASGTPLQIALALPFSEGPRFCSLSGTVVRSTDEKVGIKLDPTVPRIDREVLHGFVALLNARYQSMQ